MSDLPAEIVMQMRVAPARIIRSTRYSETAFGRSVPSAMRVPTGSSSLEKASGWMRLPMPAAGTIPQVLMPTPPLAGSPPSPPPAPPPLRRMLGQRPLAGGAGDPADLLWGKGKDGEHLLRAPRREDLPSRLE